MHFPGIENGLQSFKKLQEGFLGSTLSCKGVSGPSVYQLYFVSIYLEKGTQ